MTVTTADVRRRAAELIREEGCTRRARARMSDAYRPVSGDCEHCAGAPAEFLWWIFDGRYLRLCRPCFEADGI